METTEQSVKAHTRVFRKKKGQDTLSYPEDLPIERVVLDIPEDKKIAEDGSPFFIRRRKNRPVGGSN